MTSAVRQMLDAHPGEAPGADAELRHCIRTGLEACAAACRTCGDECSRHADMHDHCRVCAETCRRCEQACRELLAALG
jgi:hypothetical protein